MIKPIALHFAHFAIRIFCKLAILLKLTDYPKAFTEKNSVKGTLFVNHIKYSYQEDISR